ncbi:MAG: hypothetical protein SGPRY_010656 [Prymnesium sp.]
MNALGALVAEYQPLMWDHSVGKQLMSGTLVSFVAFCSAVFYLFGHEQCYQPSLGESTACHVAASLHLSNVLMNKMPWYRSTGVTWARSCMHLVNVLAAAANVMIGFGLSPTRADPMTGRMHYMLRWVEWIVLSFTMTFSTESAAAADYKSALCTALTQSLSTFCGLVLLFCTPGWWFIVTIFSFACFGHLYARVEHRWKGWQVAQRMESRNSMRWRSFKFGFHLLSICSVTWTGFVIFWMVDALVYAVLGMPRGTIDFAFYGDIVMDVMAKLVCSSLIDASSPLLATQFSLDALEIADELRGLINKAHAPIIGIDQQGKVAEWNAKMVTSTGYHRSEAMGCDLIDCFVDPAQRSSVRRILAGALAGRDMYVFELVLIKRSGERARVLLNLTARRNNEEQIVGVLGIGQDMTAIYKAEEKARKYAGDFSERLYRSYALSLDLVTQLDMSDPPEIYYASPSYLTVLGHPPSNVVDGDYNQTVRLLSPLAGKPFSYVIELMMTEDDGFTMEYPLRHVDGHEIMFEHKGSRHPDNANCLVIISRDVTDRQERHRLELDNAKLERDVEAIHFLSHELKNRFVAVRSALSSAHCPNLSLLYLPFTSVPLYTSTHCAQMRGMLESARLSVIEYASHLLSAPHNTQEVFEDMLASINRGAFLCCNHGLALQLAHDTYKPIAANVEIRSALHAASGRRADVSVDADVPNILRLDQNLLLHVLDNFVSNATQYGAASRPITLRAMRNASKLRFEVVNLPGPKHAEAQALYGDSDAVAEILRSFGQGLQRSPSSTGNGLRIARKCSQLLDGEMSLCFAPTCVIASVSVPLICEEQSTAPILPPDLQVALVDDDEIIRMLDALQFQKLGIKAHIRGSTAEEIIDFPAFVASLDPQPQLVLLDQNLDHPSHGDSLIKGTSLIPKLRSQGYSGKVIIKSANQSSADRAHYIASGADGTLDKIVRGEAFARELAAFLSGPSALESQPFDINMLCNSDGSRDHVHLFKERASQLVEKAVSQYFNGNRDRAWSSVHKLKSLARFIGAWPLAETCEALRHAEESEDWMRGLALLSEELSRVLTALQKFEESSGEITR